jgi:RimJ/RimL family protein N-acetyltransferase
VDIHTTNVTLHLLSYEEAARVLRYQHPASELWATGYPSVEQVDYLQAYLLELRGPKPSSYWQSQIRRRRDGLVIGGAGVTGPVDVRGAVIIGYEIDPTVPEEGFGPEIVGALLDVARGMGARRATTSTRATDPVRQEAYLRSGLLETTRTASQVHFAIDFSFL